MHKKVLAARLVLCIPRIELDHLFEDVVAAHVERKVSRTDVPVHAFSTGRRGK